MPRKQFSRRDVLRTAGIGGVSLVALSACSVPQTPAASTQPQGSTAGSTAASSTAAATNSQASQTNSNEEYVWLSANANLPLFVAHDHPALRQIEKELGVKCTIAGPDTVDIPGLVSAVEQTAARKPTGMMVVGWDPSALIPAIDAAISAGIPVVTVDADVPKSKRLAFVGTDWYDLGIRQGEAMARALQGKTGKVSLMGLIAGDNMQRGFAGFRSVVEKLPGITIMEPQEDKGNQAEAARVAAAIIQANPDLVGMAGFDSESGPGIGQAIKEANKAGQIAATCVDAEAQHLNLVKAGVLSAAVGQKRELFTYQGVKALHDVVHNTLNFTKDDAKAGVVPIPINYNTGTYTVTKDNVDLFLK